MLDPHSQKSSILCSKSNKDLIFTPGCDSLRHRVPFWESACVDTKPRRMLGLMVS